MVNIREVNYSGFDESKFELEKGDAFSVHIQYSGEMADFIDDTIPQDQLLDTKIMLTNKDGQIIDVWHDKINYNKGFVKTVDFISDIDTSSMDVVIDVFDKNNQVIEHYEDSFLNQNNTSQQNNNSSAISRNQNKWIFFGVIVVLPFIVILLWASKKYFWIFVLMGVSVFSLIMPEQTQARAATLVSGYGPFGMRATLTINSPPSKLCAGDEFIISGTHRKWVCSNANARTVIRSSHGSWDSGWGNYSNNSHNLTFS
jgi:hypothetical protein